jgi:hypothetical protein
MDARSRYQLQCIDANCNDCKHFVRSVQKLQASKQLHRNMDAMSIRGIRRYFWEEAQKELESSAKAKDPAIKAAKLRKYYGLLKERSRVTVDTSYKTGLVFGDCTKFNRHIETVPNACQLDTQHCFEHRRAQQFQYEQR